MPEQKVIAKHHVNECVTTYSIAIVFRHRTQTTFLRLYTKMFVVNGKFPLNREEVLNRGLAFARDDWDERFRPVGFPYGDFEPVMDSAENIASGPLV